MVSTVEPYRELVVQWRSEGLKQKAIWERIKSRSFTGSYGAVSHFVNRLEKDKKFADVTVRVERPPGDEAQVDFGYAGRLVVCQNRVVKSANKEKSLSIEKSLVLICFTTGFSSIAEASTCFVGSGFYCVTSVNNI
jgi:hypothetical protein